MTDERRLREMAEQLSEEMGLPLVCHVDDLPALEAALEAFGRAVSDAATAAERQRIKAAFDRIPPHVFSETGERRFVDAGAVAEAIEREP